MLFLRTFVLLVPIAASGCRVVIDPQQPAEGESFEAVRLSDAYALTVDTGGEPLGIWDLGYPVARRAGDEERERFPVRIVNFVDTDEMGSLQGGERWSFGYRSFFGGIVSLNALKWYQTTDLFDVREVREARRAMLHEWIRIAGPGVLSAHGVDSDELAAALAQLAEEDEERASGDLEATFRDDYRERLDEAGKEPVQGPPGEVDLAPLGDGPILVLLNDRPAALYDGDSAYVLWLDELSEDPVSDGASLGTSTAAAVVVVATGIVIGFPIGIPISLVTSVFPIAPFRKEDPYYAARGRLLARLRTPGSPLPAELELHRERLIRALEDELRAGNLYWPTSAGALAPENWSWLLEQRAGDLN